jgi:hypothetical protein
LFPKDHLKHDATANLLISYGNAASGGGCSIIGQNRIVKLLKQAIRMGSPVIVARMYPICGNGVNVRRQQPPPLPR